MKAVIQRVKHAKVVVDDSTVGEIGPGVLTLLGIVKGDSASQVDQLMDKICHLRIFEDENGKMNRSVTDINGGHLIVSQFTLAADCKTGRRPSFTHAETQEKAKELYEYAVLRSKELGISTQTGQFQANMAVHLINDGPVTFMLEF